MSGKGYDFSSPSEVKRFRQDMRNALQTLDPDCPYGRPLKRIPTLHRWWDAAKKRFGVKT